MWRSLCLLMMLHIYIYIHTLIFHVATLICLSILGYACWSWQMSRLSACHHLILSIRCVQSLRQVNDSSRMWVDWKNRRTSWGRGFEIRSKSYYLPVFLKCYFYIPGGCLEFLNYQQYQTQSHQHVVHPSWLHASWLRSATWWQTSVHSLNWIFPHPKYTPCTGKHIYRICKSTLHESNPPKGKHVFFPSRTVFFWNIMGWGCFTCTSAVATRRLDRLERLERLDMPAVKPNKDPPGGGNHGWSTYPRVYINCWWNP